MDLASTTRRRRTAWIAARLRLAFCFLLPALLAGCAQLLPHLVPQTMALRTDWPQGVPQSVELQAVPFFPQEDYQCGPAALATVLAYSGVAVTPESLVSQVYLPARQGSLQLEMLAATRRHARVAYSLAPRYGDLLREVAAGNPVIVLQDVGPLFTQWHYAVVNGFDYPSGTIYLRSGTKARREMSFTAFEREWMKSGYWAMVLASPDRIAATAGEEAWINAVIAMARSSGADAAAAAYATALARWPDNLPAAIGLANAHHERGAYADAVTVLRAAQQRHPDSVIIANNLAQVLSDQGHQREALAQIDRVSDPRNPFAAEVRATRRMILQRMSTSLAGQASTGSARTVDLRLP